MRHVHVHIGVHQGPGHAPRPGASCAGASSTSSSPASSGVAAGLIFLAWNVGYLGPKALLEPLLPGVQGLLDGPWLFAGVLGGLIIRKAGAAIYVELLAAVVSALIGNQWGGFLTLEAGLVQGLGAELVFPPFLLPPLVIAGSRSSRVPVLPSPAGSTTSCSGTPVPAPPSRRST